MSGNIPHQAVDTHRLGREKQLIQEISKDIRLIMRTLEEEALQEEVICLSIRWEKNRSTKSIENVEDQGYKQKLLTRFATSCDASGLLECLSL